MKSNNKRHARRVRNLVIIFALTAIIISVSTYAWFIGMRTVNVSSFDVEISSTDSLLLSLDGDRWDTTVAITADNFDDTTVVYENHTNTWGGAGLTPISSVGEMDVTNSRLKVFEKASLTASPGGYRIMSSRVDNTGEKELGGYVAFDLFVKNFSGRQYIKDLNLLDEEAIYLTTDSAVKASLAGVGVENTGIENSVRVAFAQIGRVEATSTDIDEITGITCNDDGEGNPSIISEITGICRTATIWEPNDTKHEENAVRWYNKSCKARTAADIMDKDSFSGECGTVANGVASPTYALKQAFGSDAMVDIYDGAAYNGYTETEELQEMDYFTDTMKVKEGTSRQELFTLAPNSITKVRVYVFIEGQDIDNYDFASIGKSIVVNFGFTKERFTPSDIEYDGPDFPSGDTTRPMITLLGEENVTIQKGEVYKDAGATAEDDVDGDLTRKIQVLNPVNTNVPGVYRVTYNVSDWQGNYALQVVRTVEVTE